VVQCFGRNLQVNLLFDACLTFLQEILSSVYLEATVSTTSNDLLTALNDERKGVVV